MKSCESEYCKCLYYTANALSRVITKMAEEEFAVTGLAPSYAFLLMTVDHKAGVQPKQISEKMMLTPSTITRLIEKMEHRRLLERKSLGKNTEVYLTKSAKSIMPKIYEAWRNLYKRYSEILGEQEGNNLTALIYEATMKLEE